MTNSTKVRVYIKLIFTTKSPFSVCSGMDEFSDKDIIKRGDEPFIPGSTLAGVFRNYIKTNGLDSSDMSIDDIDNEFFGYIIRGNSKEEHKAKQSEIIFGDAVLAEEECRDFSTNNEEDKSSTSNTEIPNKKSEPKFIISFRDGVKLDDRKTAINTGKYNYEIIEKGTKFEAIIEYCGEKADTFKELIKQIAIAINSGDLRIGSKTSRGLGYMEAEYIEKTFGKENVNKWLKFDPYCSSEWKDGNYVSSEDLGSNEIYGIEVEVQIPDTLMIRDYNVDPNIIVESNSDQSGESDCNSEQRIACKNNSKKNQVKSYPNIEKLDYGQLCLDDETPVIPGTTWAGAFRHRAKIILEEILNSMGSNAIGVDVNYDKDSVRRKINEKVNRIISIAFGQIESEQNTENAQSNNEQNSSTNNISDNKKEIYGSEDDINKKQFCKSNLSFFESEIENFTIMPITRTKIDRFTGGSMHGALFTENVCCGGETEIKIGINKKCKAKKAVLGLIFLCLDELDDGLLAVGGETAVGRGIMKVTDIKIHNDIVKEIANDIGKDIPEDKSYDMVKKECLKSLAEELRKNV